MTFARALFAIFIIAAVTLLLAVPVALRTDVPSEAGVVERFVAPGPLSSAHRALAGQCASCHTPVKGVEAKTCVSCHTSTDFGDKQSTVFHAQATECSSCHFEHQGDRGIVRMDHAALLDPKVWRQTTPPRPSGKAGPMSEAALNCSSCHSIRDKHLGQFGTDCASCHSTRSWKIEGYRHPSTNSTQCVECHKAPPSHLMEHFSMVSQRAAGEKARVDQCYACHTTDSFNNIRGRGWYDHH
ncbi:MAG: cytochrome c3 family protein [Pseudomonadota bacterium]|nr:cytochrome c3 family protein [Pseudomonadota bacterium]